MNANTHLRLIHLIHDRLGFWDTVHWRYSRRHRRYGYTFVTLPEAFQLSCRCGQTSLTSQGFGDITGFEAVMDDRRLECAHGLNVIVYEHNGQVRHERCGQTIVWMIPS